jgi:hypothetical protein
VEDRKASVNRFTTRFRAINPQDFCHLVYFQIKEGSHCIYGLLESIFLQIGKVVCQNISPGLDLNRIIVLVETMKKIVPAKLKLSYESCKDALCEDVLIEVYDKHPRCWKCLSQSHKPGNCAHAGPTRAHEEPPMRFYARSHNTFEKGYMESYCTPRPEIDGSWYNRKSRSDSSPTEVRGYTPSPDRATDPDLPAEIAAIQE